jgi:hypothetical protein
MSVTKAIVTLIAWEVRNLIVRKVRKQREKVISSVGARMLRVREQIARAKSGPP